MRPPKPTLWASPGAAVSLFAGGVLLFAHAYLLFGEVPWTDDARFYVPAARGYAEWLAALGRGEWHVLSRPAVDAAFSANHEHPPVGKYVMGLAWLVLHRGFGVEEVAACRAGVVLLFAATGVAIFSQARSHLGDFAAGLGAVTFLLLPRALFHGQVETLDMPVAALSLLSTLWFWRAHEKGGYRIGVFTLIFALTLGCKLNAFFVGAACITYTLLRVLPVPAPLAATMTVAAGSSKSRAVLLLLATGAAAPLLALALWPWLWFDTVQRLADYLGFHAHHYLILNYFAGTLYSTTPAPMSAPLTMLVMTTPPALLGLAILGLFTPWTSESLRPVRSLTLLLGLQIAAQLLAVSLPGVPKYGGIKLFLPVFPFLCLLAAYGLYASTRFLRALVHRHRLPPWVGHGIRPAVVVAVLAAPVITIVVHHGALLSSFTPWVGGLRGATAAGYERQYYDVAYIELPRLLGAALPDGGTFSIGPNAKEYIPYIQRWQRQGRLAGNLRLVPWPSVAHGESGANPKHAWVLTHERRWREYPNLVQQLRGMRRTGGIERAGVPLLSVYRAAAMREHGPAGAIE